MRQMMRRGRRRTARTAETCGYLWSWVTSPCRHARGAAEGRASRLRSVGLPTGTQGGVTGASKMSVPERGSVEIVEAAGVDVRRAGSADAADLDDGSGQAYRHPLSIADRMIEGAAGVAAL